MPITEGKIELAIADHEFPIGFPAAKAPAVPGADIVVILVHGVGLAEAEKTHFAFHAQMPAQVEIQKAADAIQTGWGRSRG